MDRQAAEALADQLRSTFHERDLNVAVGLTRSGIAIRSQDDEVDATNLAAVSAFGDPIRFGVVIDVQAPDARFEPGEILILGPGEREVGAPGRRPDDEMVEWESYSDLETAIRRAGEVR